MPADAPVDPLDLEGDVPETWLDLHGDILFRFAMLRVQNTHVAEELVQETLVNALKAYSGFRGEASVRTWLIQILRNEISRYLRRQSKEKQIQLPDAEHDPPMDMGQLLNPRMATRDFRSALEREEFWQIIRECFRKTPPHLLETFLLRMSNENEKIEQLCQQVGINPSNFSVRLFRTRLMLHRCMEKYWMNEK